MRALYPVGNDQGGRKVCSVALACRRGASKRCNRNAPLRSGVVKPWTLIVARVEADDGVRRRGSGKFSGNATSDQQSRRCGSNNQRLHPHDLPEAALPAS